MTPAISRDLINDYFRACVAREPERIAPFLDDDVSWSVIGPVDVLPFCGEHRGKRAVIDTIVRLGPSVLRIKAMELEEMLVDGDRAATFMRIIAEHGGTGRTVSYRCAQFLRFRNNKLIEFRALLDSFDAAEQMIGHPIEVTPPPFKRSNVFAV